MEALQEHWYKFNKWFRSYSTGEKVIIVFLLLALASIPPSLYLALHPIDLRNFAQTPITPPGEITPTPVTTITDWETEYAALLANNFYIEVDGKKYYGKTGDVNLHSVTPYVSSDGRKHTTLEAKWQEGVEMRLYIYFSTDNVSWQVDEMWTYNGQSQGNWIYYYPKISSTIKNNYHNSLLDVEGSSKDYPYKGIVHFENLMMTAFYQRITLTPTPTLSVPTVTPEACKTGVKSLKVVEYCKNRTQYKKVQFVCRNGYSSTLQGQCKVPLYWFREVQKACKNACNQ